MVYIAGQSAFNENGTYDHVKSDAHEIELTFENLKRALKDVGATPADIVSMSIYVVNLSPEKLELLLGGMAALYGDTPPGAHKLIGVSSLALPFMKFEVDAIVSIV